MEKLVWNEYVKYLRKHYNYNAEEAVKKRLSQTRSLMTKPLSHYLSQHSIEGTRHSLNLFMKFGCTLRTGELKNTFYKMLPTMLENIVL